MIIFALYKLLDQEFSIREKCKAAYFAQKHQLEKTHGKGNIFILQIKKCILYLQKNGQPMKMPPMTPQNYLPINPHVPQMNLQQPT